MIHRSLGRLAAFLTRRALQCTRAAGFGGRCPDGRLGPRGDRERLGDMSTSMPVTSMSSRPGWQRQALFPKGVRFYLVTAWHASLEGASLVLAGVGIHFVHAASCLRVCGPSPVLGGLRLTGPDSDRNRVALVEVSASFREFELLRD